MQEKDNSLLIFESKNTLNDGGILLYPTDTVYGLGVDALNIEAIHKLKELKGRDGKAFSVIVSDLEMAEKYVEVNDKAQEIAKKYLPGPLTIILPKKDIVPDELTEGKQTLGIRIPNNEFCIKLAKEFGRPFVSTSANVGGEETKNLTREILEQFGAKADHIDYLVDVGELPQRKPSTIVDLSSGNIEIIREGSIYIDTA